LLQKNVQAHKIKKFFSAPHLLQPPFWKKRVKEKTKMNGKNLI
jgi:hypothetical protein